MNARGVYGCARMVSVDTAPLDARGADEQGPRLGTIVKTGLVVWGVMWGLSEIRDPRPGDILRSALKPRKDWRCR